MLSNEQRLRIEFVVLRCKGACEIGRLLHELYSYTENVEKALKKADYKEWERIQSKGERKI